MHALVTWTEYKLSSDDDQWLVCSLHLALPCSDQPCPTLPCPALPCSASTLPGAAVALQMYSTSLSSPQSMWSCVHMQRSEVAAVS